jgi:hydroxyethylthiazole kinase-like uncharacterized protein yjeF
LRPLVSSDEMRAAEEAAARRGLSLPALMQMAAHGAAESLRAEQQPGKDRYLILAGPGNNGGDALVVAGLLRDTGARVKIFTYHRIRPSPVDPSGIPRVDLSEDLDGSRLSQAVAWCDVLVDGLLGIGRARPLEPDLASVIESINEAPRRPRVVSLDVPTGVDADTGRADSAAINADETLTFGYVKRGLLVYPGRAHCGAIRLIDVGLPAGPAVPVTAWLIEARDVAAMLPRRAPTAHKYSAGAVLALAGSPQYVGAPILAAMAAYRAGAGYVTLAAQQQVVDQLATRLLEATMVVIPPEPYGAIERLQGVSPRYGSLLIGPGLGRGDATTELVLQALGGALQGPHAAIVDADALFALSTVQDWWTLVSIPAVLTPHMGEMARLTGVDAAELEADRLSAAATYARLWGQVVVLKGSPTVIAAPDGQIAVNSSGSPLLATAGSGDVLSGIIAALLAGRAQPFDAARAGVYLHGLAADLAQARFGDRGMVAGDLFEYLPEATKQVLSKGFATPDGTEATASEQQSDFTL